MDSFNISEFYFFRIQKLINIPQERKANPKINQIQHRYANIFLEQQQQKHDASWKQQEEQSTTEEAINDDDNNVTAAAATIWKKKKEDDDDDDDDTYNKNNNNTTLFPLVYNDDNRGNSPRGTGDDDEIYLYSP